MASTPKWCKQGSAGLLGRVMGIATQKALPPHAVMPLPQQTRLQIARWGCSASGCNLADQPWRPLSRLQLKSCCWVVFSSVARLACSTGPSNYRRSRCGPGLCRADRSEAWRSRRRLHQASSATTNLQLIDAAKRLAGSTGLVMEGFKLP